MQRFVVDAVNEQGNKQENTQADGQTDDFGSFNFIVVGKHDQGTKQEHDTHAGKRRQSKYFPTLVSDFSDQKFWRSAQFFEIIEHIAIV